MRWKFWVTKFVRKEITAAITMAVYYYKLLNWQHSIFNFLGREVMTAR